MKKYKPTTKEELQKLVKDESIYLGDIDTSLITDMGGLFAWSGRKDFSGINEWDTSNVTDMSSMFCEFKNFNQPLNFDTKKVINFERMFYGCKNFKQKVNFDMSNAIYTDFMFDNEYIHELPCVNHSSFRKLILATKRLCVGDLECFAVLYPKQALGFFKIVMGIYNRFNSTRLFFKNIKRQILRQKRQNFYKPKNKEELEDILYDDSVYLGDIDTSLITDMSYLFMGSLRNDFSGIEKWDTSNVVNMDSMFYNCMFFNKKLEWNTSKVTDMSYMFCRCINFNQVIEFDMTNVKHTDDMFKDCINLHPKNLKSFSKDEIIENFYYLNKLPKFITKNKWVDIENGKFKPKNKAELKALVYTDGIRLDKIDTSLITDMSGLFAFSQRKDFSGVEKWDVSNVVNIENMFFACESSYNIVKFNERYSKL